LSTCFNQKKEKFSFSHFGFTLVELLIGITIFATLAGIATISLSKASRSASLNTTISSLLTDIKQQQLKAMIGDTEGRSAGSNYGVYFNSSSYTLFHGNYTAGDATNFTIQLPGNMQFTTTNVQLTFANGSGSLAAGSATAVTIRDTTNSSQKTIQFNTYGVVTAIN
jgi:prepilin-type N-terminal cleavage/methylation domain-containing protein